MNQENKIKNSRESIILIIIMSLYAIFGLYYIPYILVLFPVPFIVFGFKNGIIPNIISMIATCIIVGIVDSVGYGLFLLVIFLPISIIISYFMQKRRSSMEIIGISTLVLFISILIILGIANTSGIRFTNELENGFQNILSAQLDKYKEMDLTSYQFLEIEEFLESTYKQSLLIIPAIFMILSLIVSYLNYLLASIGLNKIGIRAINKPKFSKFRLPNNIILGIIIMFLGVALMERMEFEYSDAVLLNLTTLIGFMFLIQGLSVTDHFFTKIKLIPLVRFIIYIMFIFNQSIVLGLTILGLIDGIFDLRKIKRSRSQ